MLFIPLVLSLFLSGVKASDTPSFKARMGSESYVRLRGSTNIDPFGCMNDRVSMQQSLLIGRLIPAERKIEFSQGVILVQVDGFDCNNSLLEKDLGKTLNKEDFPNIEARLIDFRPYQDPNLRALAMCKIAVTVRGVERVYDFPFGYAYGDDVFILDGTLHLRMTSFGITPPSKMMGLVKVDDRLAIRFHLKLNLDQ